MEKLFCHDKLIAHFHLFLVDQIINNDRLCFISKHWYVWEMLQPVLKNMEPQVRGHQSITATYKISL